MGDYDNDVEMLAKQGKVKVTKNIRTHLMKCGIPVFKFGFSERVKNPALWKGV